MLVVKFSAIFGKKKFFMSRIGKLPVHVPEKVQVEIEGNNITISGPYGKLERNISTLLDIKVDEKNIILIKKINNRRTNEIYGLTRTLVNNMVIGVSQKFEKVLLLEGVGYRAQTNNNQLILNLGYSHPVALEIPSGIEVLIEKNTLIIIKGINKELIGQFSATIKSRRLPEPYKGKGVLYQGEIIKRKVGKSGK